MSLAWAMAIVWLMVGLSSLVNPMLDRRVHWDWMAVLAPAILLVVTWGIRRR